MMSMRAISSPLVGLNLSVQTGNLASTAVHGVLQVAQQVAQSMAWHMCRPTVISTETGTWGFGRSDQWLNGHLHCSHCSLAVSSSAAFLLLLDCQLGQKTWFGCG